MNKNTMLGLAAGGCLLAGITGGGAYWLKSGPAPTLAVSGADQTETAGGEQLPPPNVSVTPEPLKPIPAPEGDLADLQIRPASPARFQPPASAEAVTPAGATISDGTLAMPNANDQAPPVPPSAFVPFAGAESPENASPSGAPTASAEIGVNESSAASAQSTSDAATGSAGETPATEPRFTPATPTGNAGFNSFGPLAAPAASATETQGSTTQPPVPPTWNTTPTEPTRPLSAGPLASETRSATGEPMSSDPPSFGATQPVAAVAAPSRPGRSAVGGATPGPENLEGEQAPAVSLEKIAPPEIQVGKSATFQSVVRNIGSVPAQDVFLVDHVPQGTRLVSTSPQGSQSPDGSLAWQLGTLKPNDEVVISMELLPEQEGLIGSVAQVSFHTLASAKTTCTKPQLAVRHTAPARVLIGDSVVLAIEISNPGTGAATRVTLEEDVPQGLVHAAGRELEYDVGTLLPNETRKLDLPLAAEGPGVVTNVLRVRGEGGLLAEHSLQVEVIAPQLQVGLAGPARRYLERQVTYEVSVANPGTAPAHDIELIAYLPKGLKFIEADQQGQYDSQNHSVVWVVPELPPGQQGVVQFTALPIETGEQKTAVEGRADMGLSHRSEHTTLVEGVTQLQFSVSDVQDPIEVQADTAYEVRVTNSGTKAATNVRLIALFPAGMTPVSGEGPSRVSVQGQQASTDAMAELAPGSEAVYRLQARGAQSGDHVVRVQLVSDDSPTPVTKEESTRVYADE